MVIKDKVTTEVEPKNFVEIWNHPNMLDLKKYYHVLELNEIELSLTRHIFSFIYNLVICTFTLDAQYLLCHFKKIGHLYLCIYLFLFHLHLQHTSQWALSTQALSNTLPYWGAIVSPYSTSPHILFHNLFRVSWNFSPISRFQISARIWTWDLNSMIMIACLVRENIIMFHSWTGVNHHPWHIF